jgi:hypothetical protein
VSILQDSGCKDVRCNDVSVSCLDKYDPTALANLLNRGKVHGRLLEKLASANPPFKTFLIFHIALLNIDYYYNPTSCSEALQLQALLSMPFGRLGYINS